MIQRHQETTELKSNELGSVDCFFLSATDVNLRIKIKHIGCIARTACWYIHSI